MASSHDNEAVGSEKCTSYVSPKPERPSWSIRPSDLAKQMLNPIRMAVESIGLTFNPEKSKIVLALGDPAVFGNFPPPQEVVQAVIDAVASGSHCGYSPAIGSEKARAAAALYCSRPEAPLTKQDVVMTLGGSGALEMCISALGNRGQNILVPRPGFPLYQLLAGSLGIEVRYYNLQADNEWEVDLAQLEAVIDENSVAIIVCNPSNPCGSVYSREHLVEILEVAERKKVPIIADEVYSDCVFPPAQFVPMATLTTQVPILSCESLAKKFMVPGWRLGWICIHDCNNALGEIRSALHNLARKIPGGPNSLMQGALETILSKTPATFLKNCMSEMQATAKVAYSMLSQVAGLRPVMPNGAMYMMVGISISDFPQFTDDVEFTTALASEQSVQCLALKLFQYPNHFRLVLSVPRDLMVVACERIGDFCTQHYHSPSLS